MAGYYTLKKRIERLKLLQTVNNDDLYELLELVKDDNKIKNEFYINNKNDTWLNYLCEANQFLDLPPVVKDGDTKIYHRWFQGDYLIAVAGKQPKKVLSIIKDIDTDNIRVFRNCLMALNEMPIDVAIQGMELIRRFLVKKDIYNDWFYIGEQTAKLMVKFAEEGYIEQAFEIAEKLLDVNVKKGDRWYDLKARFDTYYFNEFVFKYLNILIENDEHSLRAGKLLIDLLDRQIEIEQQKINKEPVPEKIQKKLQEVLGKSEDEDEKPFEVTEHSYILIPQIDSAEEGREDVANILIGGVRAAGEYLMQHNLCKAEEYIEYLRSKKRSLYKRIIIHLYRFAPDDETWKDRIESILQNTENVNDYNTANEYKSLLHDKYKIITQKTRDIFLSWVEERAKIEDEKEFQEWFQKHRGRKAEKEDIEQYQNYLRAKELYCIKDKEQEKYEECIKKSGKTEKAVKPRPIGARMYSPAAPEYSPLSQDNIQQRTPEEVITDILDYDSSQGDIKEIDEEEGFSIDRKEALASIFSNDLKERLAEYLKVDVSIITRLSHKFIDKVFDAVIFVIQNKKIESPDWNTIIKLCKEVHDSRLSDNKYRWVMRSINGVLELALTGDRCKDVINEGHLQIIWNIFTSLLDYPLEIDEEEDGNDNYNDPYQKFINRVRGRAFESIIQFGLFCKNYQKELFDKVYSTELKNKLQNVLDNVKRPEIICGFGVYYVKLCWIDENWVRENLDRIFPEDDVQAWNAVWGSYIKWSRPSESAFKIAKDKYAHAIDVIKGQIVYQDKENYNKRLMEHVMLAYWQGWTGLEENDLIRNLLAKMDDQMRAKACHWITTGFEYLHKHEDDGWKKGVKDRLLAYWEWRYGIMNDNPEEHNAEACEFTGWAKDSPFDPNQTLDIIEKSQEIAGKISGRMSSVAKFVEGLSAITKNRELRVLEILRKAVKDPNVEQWSWEYEKVKESLVAMMDHIIKLDNEYPEIDQIRHCAIDIADSLGRLGNEYLRTHYDTLMEQVSGK